MAAKVGGAVGHDHHMAKTPGELPVAPGAGVGLVGLVGLDAANLDRAGIERVGWSLAPARSAHPKIPQTTRPAHTTRAAITIRKSAGVLSVF